MTHRKQRSHPITLALLSLLFCATAAAGDWPAWRGPAGDGTTGERDLPTTWSATENIAWKTPLPGPGNSTPIVLGERIFMTGATDGGATRSVYCFDRQTGKELWRSDLSFTGEEPTHETNPYSSASPVTDGESVYAWQGSAGVVAYDLEGKQLWHKDLGPFLHIWGNAASPVVHGENLIISCGPGPRSMLVALDRKSGEIVWQTDFPDARGEKPDDWKGSWATPVLRKTSDGGDEIVLPLPEYVAGFDPANGKEIWRCRGLSDLAYANALIGNDTIVAMSGYQGPSIGLRAPAAGETGDLTDTHRLWLVEKNPQRVGSGVISGDYIYILNDPGVAQCIELKTRKEVWKERASASSWGSMVLAGDLLYVTD